MIKSESSISVSENNQGHALEPFSITYLLKLWQDQSSLLAEMDTQIGRFMDQLSGYEQELYEKDSYIRQLEDRLKRAAKKFQIEGKVL